MRDYEQCRPYIEHWIAEHRRLHGLMRKAHAAVMQTGGPDPDAAPHHVVAGLRQLREELVRHFREEEAGGCMEEAACMCPRLGPEVQRIEAEHGELLARLDVLIAQAADLDESVAKRLAFDREFNDLCRQLHAHEAAENNILKQGFGTNFNGEEAGRPMVILDA
jgi:iron-sulfur cluster repair protein YtfE (RIC family)